MSERALSNRSSRFNLGIQLPAHPGTFRVRATANFSQSKSNNDYEAVYREYNYHNANSSVWIYL